MSIQNEKCIVFRCSNRRNDGKFVGELCAHCHYMITTGKLGNLDSFLGAIRHNLTVIRLAVEELEKQTR